MEPSRTGTRKRKRSTVRRSVEYLYPCVSRLRRRRLLAFLSRHGFSSTFQAFAMESKVFFSVAHLQRLARLGQWDEAIGYFYRFVPNVDLLGEEGRLFFHFLSVHKIIHSIATGSPGGAVLTELYERELMERPNNPDPASVKLICMLSALCRSHQPRTSVNWHLVRCKAAEILKDLIARTPEFNDLVRLPNCPDKPHTVLPIRPCSQQRHHVKKIDRTSASDIAEFYLQKKRSVPALSRFEASSEVSGLSCKAALALLADLIDISVRAGMNRLVQDDHPSEDSSKQ